MKFRAVQDNLRKELWRRIEAGQLTGLKLAQQTGFQQAHISNFLNGKRGLSLEGMDRVLAVQKLSVLDLLDATEVNKRASIPPPATDGFQNVLMADGHILASEPQIRREHVRDILKYKKSFLRRLRARMESAREDWQRFVLLRIGQDDADSMYPRLLPNTVVLIDRHYNSLKPYRRGQPNLYAVRKGEACVVRYVELVGGHLVLRPHNQAHPVDVVVVEEGHNFPEYLVGRVCHVAMET